MTFDDKKNLIEVCLFESYLAQYFIEHPEIFQPLINKVLEAVEQIITSNSENSMFNRVLFSVFSQLVEECPEIKDMNALKGSKSLVAFDTFCKYFAERIMVLTSIKLPEIELENSGEITSLSTLAQHSLFKSKQYGEAIFLKKMRPAYLFSDKNRGVIEITDLDSEKETRNLGILSSENTPDSLKDFFSLPHYPSRQYYKAKEDSLMALWLREHYLPVISGASGGIGKTVSKINSFVMLSKTEYQLLGILVASSTIALGHHSFFEVIRPLSFFSGELEEKSNLLEFYEQAIPEEVKRLPSYQAHIASHFKLIEEITFGALEGEYNFTK
ncbi:hypothetical protein [Legionella maioricensis]|uniref:Uncharacterized protein n=1 Tax=Legionella maioricensis TaxID=2896528 RepID=A0A9X2ID52_9GAMM|nr:hypothetical protein [Legionella maioricensis]MCL9684413.1 hypothetical protein [Legionella maioricensis]MCL9687594.1 hypothetical protein [Legionella maioricensis]